MVSAVAAYIGGINGRFQTSLRSSGNVTKMINYMATRIGVTEDQKLCNGSGDCSYLEVEEPLYNPKVVWNGNVREENCLGTYSSNEARAVCDDRFRNIPSDLNNWDGSPPSGGPGGGSGGGGGGSGGDGDEGGIVW
jgi:hypothetical protein